MTVKLLILPFLFALFLQMLICFKIRNDSWKILPIAIDLIAFFYAGARFLGIIGYESDTAGIVEGGLAAGIFVGIMAAAGLVGIVLAWVIYYSVGRHKAPDMRSR